MPTLDPSAALDLDAAREVVRVHTFEPPRAQAPGVGRIGLEPERFAMRVDASGRPGARMALVGPGGVLECLSAARDLELGAAHFDAHPLTMDLPRGGNVTFEPGAQLEHSTAVYDSASMALDDVLFVGGAMERAVAHTGARLFSLGVDPWHSPSDVPQQLDAPRYRAMASYLGSRSPMGAWMMRLSCSLQVNLDLGAATVAKARYTVANLLSPLLVGVFSTSPELPGEPRRHSRRARIWQEMDPTRSGFPVDFIADRGTPLEQYTRAALEADVLLVRTGNDAHPGHAGWRFIDWLENGHPELGRPTADDLRYHLSTLFFEVRVRGFHELRGIDALPPCWRAAAVAFTAGVLYDDRALEQALALLAPWRGDLPQRWVRAGEVGLHDPELRRISSAIFDLALDGIERLGPDFLRPEHQGDAAAFAERFTKRGLAPADELRALLDQPVAAVDWALGAGCRRGALTVGV